MAYKRSAAGRRRSRRAQAPRVLPGAVDRHLAGDVHHCREGLHRGRRDGLEDLLVGPAGLARLLMEVHRRLSLGLNERAEVAQERGLALVARVPLLREGDLVQRETRLPGRAAVHLVAGLGVVVLRDGERDALEGRQGQRAVAKLGAKAGVGAQGGGRAGEDAEEVRQLAAGGERAAQDRDRSLGGGELVVDVEAAHGGLHRDRAFCGRRRGGGFRAEQCPSHYFLTNRKSTARRKPWQRSIPESARSVRSLDSLLTMWARSRAGVSAGR